MSLIVRIGRPGSESLDRILDEASDRPLTYDHPRSSLDGGDGVRSWTLALPVTPDPFEPAVDALRSFVPQRGGAGATLHPSDPDVVEGATLLVVLPLGPVSVVAPDRIVAVVDEPGRFGFVYGTLPGHPFEGEESFLVHRREDGRALFTVTADTRPSGWLRLFGPVLRAIQSIMARRYLRAMARSVLTGADR